MCSSFDLLQLSDHTLSLTALVDIECQISLTTNKINGPSAMCDLEPNDDI